MACAGPDKRKGRVTSHCGCLVFARATRGKPKHPRRHPDVADPRGRRQPRRGVLSRLSRLPRLSGLRWCHERALAHERRGRAAQRCATAANDRPVDGDRPRGGQHDRLTVCAPARVTSCSAAARASTAGVSAVCRSKTASSCASASLSAWKPRRPSFWAQRTTVAVEVSACAATRDHLEVVVHLDDPRVVRVPVHLAVEDPVAFGEGRPPGPARDSPLHA
jgi:hypothetical protein